MSVLNNSLLLGADAGGAAGYSISRSLRFNSADSAYLSRTPASAGNRRTWTWAGWVKRSSLATDRQQTFFSASAGTGTIEGMVSIKFVDTQKISFISWTGPGANREIETTALFRDASAWYHIVAVFDTTSATASSRLRLYVNGLQITALTKSTYPDQNAQYEVNNTSAHNVGRLAYGPGEYFDGLLADVHFIDGQALDPTSFGEFSATTGVWVPKAYSGGSYGTNGFHLDFADNSAATAAALGKDTSGAGNNWTPNNLSVTAGAGNDSLVDVPTNGSEVDTGLGGQVRGNYCTLNPLNTFTSNITLSNGNLEYSQSVTGGLTVATIGVSSGKWYWEHVITGSYCLVGAYQSGALNMVYLGAAGVSFGLTPAAGSFQSGISAPTGSITFTTSDVVGFALNMDAGTCTVYKNGVSSLVYSGLTGTWFPAQGANSNPVTGYFNFGQRPFAYTAPSGFKALCTANLPAPTIVKPSTVFDTKLYTSNAGTNVISGLGFSPDFAWLKSRGTGVAHALYDTVRGAGYALSSNLTDAEKYTTDGFVSFNSDGFTLGANVNSPQPDINFTNAVARVAWCWDAGNTTVTNTAGSITSQVRANASAGFSIVAWTAQASAGTVGHGLGVPPEFIIIKDRGAANNWIIYHKSVGTQAFLRFTTSAATNSAVYFDTAPTPSVFTPGSVFTNASFGNLIGYCFAPVAGLSSFGSYTGNGSADGPFVFTGMRPRYLLWKRSDATADWTVFDAARDTYNYAEKQLLPNSSSAEQVTGGGFVRIDFLSNGFKIRSTDSYVNASGGTYIYAAFAEAPFQYARAR